MANYIERTQIKANTVTLSQKEMCTNYENMLNNVTNMLNVEGPVTSTWIKFKIGTDNNKNPIIFDSSSTNPKKNLIASLSFTKSTAGTANNFTLVVQYDPFNMGQEIADIIEQLDEYVAQSMSYDFDTDLNTMRGHLQFGYNAVSDSALVSPDYTFFLTSAVSEVKFESGISTYTFEGTSTIGADSDNSTKFPAVSEEKELKIVEETLYYWYGDPAKKPSRITNITPMDNEYKYYIDIPDYLYEDSPDIGQAIPEQSGMSPIEYCQQILNDNPLTKSEQNSGIYSDMTKLTYAQRPRYCIYIDDAALAIRVTHVVPKVTSSNTDENGVSEESELKINYKFYWGQKTQNIVVGWRPEVNNMLYLIRKARVLRYEQDSLAQIQNSENENSKQSINDKLIRVNDDLNEMYDAQLQILGIPADPPIGALIPILPTILETPSRTAGFYMINGCTDNISTNGVYITTLNLFRIRGLDDPAKYLEPPSEEDTIQPGNSSDNTEYIPNYDGSGGSFSQGGGGGRWPEVAAVGR